MRRLATRLAPPLAAVAAAVAVALALPDGGSGGAGAQTGVAAETSKASSEPQTPAVVDPEGVAARLPRRPYAILLVLDEFPGDALLRHDRRIDPIRYPNFAAFAGNATWYRNAWSAYDSTTKAVPLILDGMRPRPGTAPTYRDHPHTIFELFGRHRYRIKTFEEATAMCAPRWCPNGRRSPPAVVPRLQSGRPQRFGRFIRSIEPGRPTFWFKHALLPHKPYMYLPSGHRTRGRGPDPLAGMDTVPGFYDEYLTRHNEQRFLLQLGFVDRLLGRLFERLRRQGMFDQTLVAITADHGLAWKVNVPTRRSVDASNVEEIAPVPLLIKAPGQRRGSVSSSLVSTLDVTPTIAATLGWRLPYRADGRAASSRTVKRRRFVRLSNREFTTTIVISGARWKARRRAVVRRRLSQFGSGDSGLFSGIGPHPQLVGQPVGTEARARPSVMRVRLANARGYRAVRPTTGVVPTQIAGDLDGGERGATRDLAVAVNGRVEAVGRSFYLVGDRTEHFALNVPESSLRAGRNEVVLYEVLAGGALRALARG